MTTRPSTAVEPPPKRLRIADLAPLVGLCEQRLRPAELGPGVVFPWAHTRALRLLQNVSRPYGDRGGCDSHCRDKCTTYHSDVWNGASYCGILASLEAAQYKIRLCVASRVPYDDLMALVDREVLQPLAFVRELSERILWVARTEREINPLEHDIDVRVGLGPKGAAPMLMALDDVYRASAAAPGFSRNRQGVEDVLRDTSSAILECIATMIKTREYFSFVPEGSFRDLGLIICKRDDELPTGTWPHASFRDLNLELDSPALITGVLTETLGHASNSALMSHRVVDGSEAGLRSFFLYWVLPMLNEVERPDYREVYEIFEACCEGLAQKCQQYIDKNNNLATPPSSSQ